MTNIHEALHVVKGMTEAQLTALAMRSGVPLPTLHKIRYGQTKNPRIDTVVRIAENLEPVA